MIPFFLNVYITARKAPKVTVNDPWGYGASLEWATSCPPPRHNFTSIPRIRSERPAFDLNHPEAGIPVGIGPAKDAPDAPTYDLCREGEVSHESERQSLLDPRGLLRSSSPASTSSGASLDTGPRSRSGSAPSRSIALGRACRCSSRSTSAGCTAPRAANCRRTRSSANIDDGDPELGLLQPVELVADHPRPAAARS